MFITLADSSLSPTKKEDDKVENLIDKDTPHSRKYVKKRGPKHDNRKRRITDKDEDLKSGVDYSKDMSLNYKYSAYDLLSFISLRVADSSDDKKQLEAAVKSFENDLREVSSDLANQFRAYAKFAYIDDFNTQIQDGWEDSPEEYINIIKADRKDLQSRKKNLTSSLESSDIDAIVDIIVSSWPNGVETKFSERAAVIGALKRVIDQVSLPKSLKVPFMRKNIKDTINDKKFIKYIVENSQYGSGNKFDPDEIPRFAQLVAAFQVVSANPSSVSAGSMKKGIDKLTKEVETQFRELAGLSSIMTEWHDAISQFKHEPQKELELGKSSKDYDKVINAVDDFFNKPSKVIDLDSYKKEMEDFAKSNYGGVPEDMKDIFRAATSNEKISNRNMSIKTAEYHGVVQQRANPVQTTDTGYKSYDKRYFGKNHYDSIIKCAQTILKDDGWFKSGWDKGFEDASFRAALDLAIHTADDSLYQSKIDVEQYNILLNKLAKWGYQTFSDTVLPFKNGSKREASMKQSQRVILQIANDLRKSNPKASIVLLKSIKASEDIEFSAIPQDEFEDLKKEVEGKFDWESTDLESFMSGFDSAFETLQKKVSSYVGPLFRKIWASRTRISSFHIADLDPKLVNQWIEEAKAKLDKLFTEDDLGEFIDGFEDIYSEVQDEVKKQATAVVPMGSLVQLAAKHPEVRQVLIPFIVSQKEAHIAKTKKSNKKAPPFSAKVKKEEDKAAKAKKDKKKTSKKKSRKASYTSEDLNW